jgi:hypothetical protein
VQRQGVVAVAAARQVGRRPRPPLRGARRMQHAAAPALTTEAVPSSRLLALAPFASSSQQQPAASRPQQRSAQGSFDQCTVHLAMPEPAEQLLCGLHVVFVPSAFPIPPRSHPGHAHPGRSRQTLQTSRPQRQSRQTDRMRISREEKKCCCAPRTLVVVVRRD